MSQVIVVTGMPAAGKSTLARRIAADLCIPLLEKDAIKETLFDSLGTGDATWSHRLGGASYDVLYTVLQSLVAARVPVCLEANLPVDPWSDKLRTLAVDHSLHVLQIVCTASIEVILARWRERREQPLRHPGHLDENTPISAETVQRWSHLHGRLDIDGPVINADTSRPETLDYPALLDSVRQHVNERSPV
jgi:predicted kinase